MSSFPQQVSSKLAGRCQPGPRKAAAASSMVCLHPGAVTFSCVRSMNHLLTSHHSEYFTTVRPCLNTIQISSYTSRVQMITLSVLQAAHVWRLRGLEGSFAKPSTCCLLWTSEQETPARSKHCHSPAHRFVLEKKKMVVSLLQSIDSRE